MKDIELTNLIREEILLAKKTYALPIYSEDYIKNEDEHLDLMINNNLFLDTLLCQIRGIIITHSKRRANNFRKEEKDLEKKILDTEIKLDNGENIILIKDKLDELNNLLIDHRENKLKGHQIRSRSNLIKDWEKPSKLIDENDKVINNSKEILKMQETFYRDLFTSSNNKIDKDSKYFEYLTNIPKLNVDL